LQLQIVLSVVLFCRCGIELFVVKNSIHFFTTNKQLNIPGMNNNFSIAVHGGAGTILRSTMTPELQLQYETGLNAALAAGYKILESGGSSLNAVEAAVASLEDFPLFNAGRGAVFNNLGKHEMDAAIMFGKNLAAGAVSGVSNIKNPVKLAREIMEHSGHVLLSGEGAEHFARLHNLMFEGDAYFFTEQRYRQWQDALQEDSVMLDHSGKKFGTVGAVAQDKDGNLAAATSTGGMTNKKFGRVGDSPVIGAGTYANNNTCAVSCTGHGELFIRSVVAYDISCLMEYKGVSLKEACDLVVYDKLVKIGGEGGLIAIDKSGNIEMPFNSDGMYRACRSSGGRYEVKIYP
jgi:L-asparaginase / beta-aspartyl-peptidase